MLYESVPLSLRKETSISSRLLYYVLILSVLLGSVKESYMAFDLVSRKGEQFCTVSYK